jgi:hypothetical protein
MNTDVRPGEVPGVARVSNLSLAPSTSVLCNPLFRVVITCLWITIPMILLRVNPTIAGKFLPHPYLASYLEILLAGLIPVCFTMLGKEKWSNYGLIGSGLAKSLFWSVVLVSICFCFSRLTTGHWLDFMLARVLSAAVNGIEAFPVEVEVNSGWGDTSSSSSGCRMRRSRNRATASTALTNSGFKFPMGRTTINLAPADVKKEGPSFDLPIAIGMLAASEQFETDQLDNFVMVGELALTGAVRPVKGVLPIAWRARAEGKAGVLVPAENAAEAAVVEGLQVIPVENLREAAAFSKAKSKSRRRKWT